MKLPSRVIVLLMAMAMAVAVLMGCEWTSGGGVDSWSDAFNWVNFSGVYRGIGGGVLVTDYSTTPGTSGTTNGASEVVGVGNGDTTYIGSLGHESVVPGSLTITAGSFVLKDNGSGVLSGSGRTGGISYGTGSWSIDLKGAPLASGEKIIATYQYVIAGTSGSGSAGSGASRITIYSFTVQQQGQNITIVDNNGSTYEGDFSNIRSTGGSDQDNQTTPSAGDSVIGSFKASGVSAAGFNVEIVGTFQGVVGVGTGNSFYLGNRQIFGTWIEDGGRTGDINGESSPIPITVTTTTQ
jgi:hypothetical protein